MSRATKMHLRGLVITATTSFGPPFITATSDFAFCAENTMLGPGLKVGPGRPGRSPGTL